MTTEDILFTCTISAHECMLLSGVRFQGCKNVGISIQKKLTINDITKTFL